MLAKVALLLLVTVAVSNSNPAAGKPWHWKTRYPTVSPNPNGFPLHEHVLPKNPEPAYIKGTRAVPGCGISRSEGRIVGGTEATKHSYPWMAALFIDGGYFCGGSLINDEWVLTAAHCTDGASYAEVVLGAHNIRQNEPSQQTFRSTNMFEHENWSSWSLANDIALIKLPRKVNFNQYITPVCLPTYSDVGDSFVGVQVTPSGWGKPRDSSSGISDVLRHVTAPTISNAVCRQSFGIITSKHLCIDTAGGKSTCNGDSGGPLNHKSGGKTTSYGITSFGSSAGCERGYPAAFTRVTEFLRWIETKTGITIDN